MAFFFHLNPESVESASPFESVLPGFNLICWSLTGKEEEEEDNHLAALESPEGV